MERRRSPHADGGHHEVGSQGHRAEEPDGHSVDRPAAYQNNEDPAAIWAAPDRYKKIDAAMIHQAAKKYLSGENRVQITLVPEEQ